MWTLLCLSVGAAAERFCINCPEESSISGSPLDAVSADGEVFSVSSQVSRVEWTPNAAFANELATLDRPAILTNTIASGWLAAAWTPENLAARLENTTLWMKTTSDPTSTFYYCHSTPFSNLSFVNDYTARCFNKTEVSGKDFFATIDGRQGPRSSASVLDSWGSEWWKEVFPIEPMIVTQQTEGYKTELNHLFRQTHVWLSSPNTTTPAHYDVSHNLYFQIYGRKRFLLAPPSAWEQLYLYPVLHPGHRSSQVILREKGSRRVCNPT